MFPSGMAALFDKITVKRVVHEEREVIFVQRIQDIDLYNESLQKTGTSSGEGG